MAYDVTYEEYDFSTCLTVRTWTERVECELTEYELTTFDVETCETTSEWITICDDCCCVDELTGDPDGSGSGSGSSRTGLAVEYSSVDLATCEVVSTSCAWLEDCDSGGDGGSGSSGSGGVSTVDVDICGDGNIVTLPRTIYLRFLTRPFGGVVESSYCPDYFAQVFSMEWSDADNWWRAEGESPHTFPAPAFIEVWCSMRFTLGIGDVGGGICFSLSGEAKAMRLIFAPPPEVVANDTATCIPEASSYSVSPLYLEFTFAECGVNWEVSISES